MQSLIVMQKQIDDMAKVAVQKYPSFCKLGEDGVLELYCDNVMLSSYRKCQGAFFEEFMSHPGQRLAPRDRVWALEFGGYVHKCLEYFYQAKRDNWQGRFGFAPIVAGDAEVSDKQDYITWMKICTYLWKRYDFDSLRDLKPYKELGGMAGMMLLCSEYYKTHVQDNRFKYVGWELSFGRAKEVPILEDPEIPFRAYLTGRIDLVVDDGKTIGPMDFKTTKYFDGTESSKFKPNDGPQGYVYSWQQIEPKEFKAQGRQCNTIYIEHISIRSTQNMWERFKFAPITYTPAEMEEWKERQKETFYGIFRLLLGRAPTWDTSRCKNWYFSSQCPYNKIHEVPPSFRDNLIKLEYQLKKEWSPYSNGDN